MPIPRKIYAEVELGQQYPILQTDTFRVTESIIRLSLIRDDVKQLAAIDYDNSESPPIATEQMGHMTVRDASYEFGLSRRYLQELCKSGTVDATKVGGLWYIRYESLVKHIRDNIENSSKNGRKRIQLPESTAGLQITPGAKELRQTLVDCFDMSELKGLCFELGIDLEQIPGNHKGEKVLELILWAVRSRRLDQLFQSVQQLRPGVRWEPVSE